MNERLFARERGSRCLLLYTYFCYICCTGKAVRSKLVYISNTTPTELSILTVKDVENITYLVYSYSFIPQTLFNFTRQFLSNLHTNHRKILILANIYR